MKTLCRASASGFSLENAHTLDEIENMSDEERVGLILPTERVFEKYPKVVLPDFFARLARSGLEIYLKKISFAANEGEIYRLCDNDGFFAVGEVRAFEEGLAIKPIRQF